MNKTHVRAGRLAGLHRQTLRARGAALAIDTVNAWLNDSPDPAAGSLRYELHEAAVAAFPALHQQHKRQMHLRVRCDVGYDTRLARANGWGSAGDKCPAGHDAKTPAAREQVAASRRRYRGARRVATAPGRDTSACASAQPTRGAVA